MNILGYADLELRVRETDWSSLTAHLFPGDHDEHGAVLLCGRSRTERGDRLTVREVIPAIDGVDYVAGTRGYRHLKGEFVTHQIRRARDLELVYLAVHNHGGDDEVAFSGPDLDSHERAYPTLLKLSKRAVGALVCTRQAVAGDIWEVDGTRMHVGRTVVVGRSRRVLTPAPRRPLSRDDDFRFDRQALLFGSDGQGMLASTTVAIIGCGGVGMILVELLARLGVGRLIVIDPERIESTNLPRLPGASRRDAMEYFDRCGTPKWLRQFARRFTRHKVRVAQRIAARANHQIIVEGIVGDVADADIALRLRDADYLLLAADTMLARDVVNQLSYQYLIPALQVGSKVVIDPRTGNIGDVFAVVRHLGIAAGCLRCSGLIDPTRLAEEALGDPDQVARQRYVDDPDVHAPSVITVNALGAAFAANDLMMHTVGLGGAEPSHRFLRNRTVGRSGSNVTVVDPTADSRCSVCSLANSSALSRGDGFDLPTRVQPRQQ